MEGRPLRVTVVTNIPVPYRIPVYERIDAMPDVEFSAVYLSEREPNRHWRLPPSSVRSITLPGRAVRIGTRWVHVNTRVFSTLRRLRPEVVITTGYNPSQLLAVLWAVLHRVPHVVQTDGTVTSERGLGGLHRLVRRSVRRVSRAFIGASDGSIRLLRGFGAPPARVFRSPLAVDNAAFSAPEGERPVDLLFSGQLSEIKNPRFAVQVAAAVSARLGRPIRLAIAGTGPEEEVVRTLAASMGGVDAELLGFLQQDQLPALFLASRVFLFPTRWDPWGLVANEASAAAVPVLVTPAAGCADDLVRDGETGFVMPLDVDRWADRATDLLLHEELRAAMGAAARRRVEGYSFDAAAEGIARAAWAAALRS